MKITFKQKAKCGAKEGNPDKIFNSFNTIPGALFLYKHCLSYCLPKKFILLLLGKRKRDK